MVLSKTAKGVKSDEEDEQGMLDKIGSDLMLKSSMAERKMRLFRHFMLEKNIENQENNEGRQAKNGGVKGRDGSAEELDRETGEEPITVGLTRRKDGG